MLTRSPRLRVSRESSIDWMPPPERMSILEYAVKTTLFLLVVGLLAYFVGAPDDSQTTTSAVLPESTPAQSAASEQVKIRQPRAICVIRPIGDSGVSGTLSLMDLGDEIEIRGEIEGLTPGQHGFHIHEFGDLSDSNTGKSAGGHFDPTHQPHGAQDTKQRHVGDLGNIEAGKDGKAIVNIRDSVLQFGGAHSIIGRSILIHADVDKFTQPAGDAGARVAFGVIGIAGRE